MRASRRYTEALDSYASGHAGRWIGSLSSPNLNPNPKLNPNPYPDPNPNPNPNQVDRLSGRPDALFVHGAF
eukprot:scaffold112328_cov51-Phaeocystis_antarctica.AAC.2